MDQNRDELEKLRYVSGMLGQLARLLPPPRRSMLAYLIDMSRLEAEREINSRKRTG